mmetsp:Transcript_52309/g.162379  ORF Transcript_52309/g.162379 Transcript_52309/m.162379 type:complete len:291 (+) Transcript_52309:250-1122(+)
MPACRESGSHGQVSKMQPSSISDVLFQCLVAVDMPSSTRVRVIVSPYAICSLLVAPDRRVVPPASQLEVGAEKSPDVVEPVGHFMPHKTPKGSQIVGREGRTRVSPSSDEGKLKEGRGDEERVGVDVVEGVDGHRAEVSPPVSPPLDSSELRDLVGDDFLGYVDRVLKPPLMMYDEAKGFNVPRSSYLHVHVRQLDQSDSLAALRHPRGSSDDLCELLLQLADHPLRSRCHVITTSMLLVSLPDDVRHEQVQGMEANAPPRWISFDAIQSLPKLKVCNLKRMSEMPDEVV